MSIKSVSEANAANLFKSSSSKNNSLEESFESFLAQDVKSADEKKEAAKNEQTAKIEKFKQDLFNYGPMGLAFKLNMDKIQEKLDKKREELKALYGVENMQGDELTKTLKAIDEVMMIYEKQIREELKAQSELEKQQNPAKA